MSPKQETKSTKVKAQLSQETLANLTKISPDAAQTMFQKLYDQWVNCSEFRKASVIGRYGCSLVQKQLDPLIIAALLNHDLDAFKPVYKQLLANKQLNRRDVFFMACMTGSKDIGNWLMSQINESAHPLTEDEVANVFTFIANSGNLEWIKDLMASNNLDQAPDACFRFVSDSESQALAQLASDLLTGSSETPKPNV